jgi:hypothetical protein
MDDLDQFFARVGLDRIVVRSGRHEVLTDMLLQNLSHQSVDRAARRCDPLKQV